MIYVTQTYNAFIAARSRHCTTMAPAAVANRVPYGAHVILLFTLAFATFILK